MTKVIVENRADGISLNEVDISTPIFAIKNGQIEGMVVKEGDNGWIVRIGGGNGCNGFHTDRYLCMMTASEQFGYGFAIDLEIGE